MNAMTCNHGLGPVSKIAFALQIVQGRPWWRAFRKTYWLRCIRCDLKQREP